MFSLNQTGIHLLANARQVYPFLMPFVYSVYKIYMDTKDREKHENDSLQQHQIDRLCHNSSLKSGLMEENL